MPYTSAILITTDMTVPTTGEMAVGQFPPVFTDGPSKFVTLFALVNVTVGTGANFVSARIRKGVGLSGPIVGEAAGKTTSGGSTEVLSVYATFQPGDVAGDVYTLTVSQSAATATGTVNNAELITIVH